MLVAYCPFLRVSWSWSTECQIVLHPGTWPVKLWSKGRFEWTLKVHWRFLIVQD